MLLALLVVLVILLPIIKLRLIGADEKLHAGDAFLYLGSVLLITSGLTLVVLDYAAYQTLHEKMADGARVIADEVDRQFTNECGEPWRTLERHSGQRRANCGMSNCQISPYHK